MFFPCKFGPPLTQFAESGEKTHQSGGTRQPGRWFLIDPSTGGVRADFEGKSDSRHHQPRVCFESHCEILFPSVLSGAVGGSPSKTAVFDADACRAASDWPLLLLKQAAALRHQRRTERKRSAAFSKEKAVRKRLRGRRAAVMTGVVSGGTNNTTAGNKSINK